MAKKRFKLSALAQLFANSLNAHAKAYGFELDTVTGFQMGTDYDEIEIFNRDVKVRISVGLGHFDFANKTVPSNNYGKVMVHANFNHIPGGCYSSVYMNGRLDFDYSDTTKKIDVAPMLDLFEKVTVRFAQVKKLIDEPIC